MGNDLVRHPDGKLDIFIDDDGTAKRATEWDPEGFVTQAVPVKFETVATDSKDRPVQFEVDGKLYRAGAWGKDGSVRDYAEENRPKNADEPRRTAVDTVSDLGKGFVKGAGQTVATIGRGLNALNEFQYPGTPEPAPEAGINVLERMSEPTNTPQKIGAGVEQTGEMMLTGGPVREGAATLATKAIPFLEKAPALLRQAPKAVAIGSEAANAGGNAAAHGENPGIPALVSGVFTGLGQAAESLAPSLIKGAREQYGRVLAATTKRNKATSERIVPELIARGETGSAEGLAERATANVKKYGEQIDDAVATAKDLYVETRPIIESLKNYRNEFVVNNEFGKKVIDENAVKHVDDLIATIDDLSRGEVTLANGAKSAIRKVQLGPNGKPVPVTAFQDLNKVRQIWDSVVAKADGYGAADLAEGSLVEAKREGANAIRAALAEARPDIAEINAKFRLWKGLSDVLEDTLLRRQGQSGGLPGVFSGMTALTTGGGTAAANIMGGGAPAESALLGAATTAAMYGMLGLVDAARKSGAINTLSAVAKDRLAKAMMEGNIAAVSELLGKGTAAATGRSRLESLQAPRINGNGQPDGGR